MTAETLHAFLEFWAHRWPDRPAIHTPDGVATWGSLNHAADAVAAGLQACGLAPGKTVGVLMSNRLEFIQLMFGVFKCGGTLVLLNTRYTAAEIAHPIADAEIGIVVTERRYLSLLADVRRLRPHLQIICADEVEGEQAFAQLIARDQAPRKVDVDGKDIALVCYTSGTTGVPKGAMLSHQNIYSAAAARSLALGFNHTHRILNPLPLAFTGGAVGVIRDCVVPGATCFLYPVSDPGSYLETIERERITSVAAVATMYEQMMLHPDFQKRDLSSLQHAIAGGSTISQRVLRAWQERGVPLVQGYGLTESAGSYVTILFGEDAERRKGFAGRKLPNVEISLRNSEGAEMDVNEPGEIWIKGPIVTSGYLNAPELTSQVLVDGWFKTGDIGLVDDQGYLKVVDRSKDMLISGGLNVYPAELERVLAGAGGLAEFVVIGVPDERWGEVPAVVVKDIRSLDLVIFQQTCERELSDYKRPKYLIEHLGEMPLTLSGKVQKAVLKAQYKVIPSDAIRCKEILQACP